MKEMSGYEEFSQEQAKEMFFASMSHELRAPINGVLGMNEVILRESTEEKVLECAKNIEGSGKMLLAIVNDLLDFTKAEAGKLVLVEEDYRREGFCEYVSKPVSAIKLYEVLMANLPGTALE